MGWSGGKKEWGDGDGDGVVRRGMGRWEWSGGDEDRVMEMGW